MKKKTLIGSILATVIIVLATCTPAVCAADLNNVKKVTVKTTIYRLLGKEEIVTEVFEEEAAEIMDKLELYRLSLIKGDKQLIEKYESLLVDSGIFGKDYNPFNKKEILSVLLERYRSMVPNNPSSLVEENRLCFVNAIGKGNLTFAFDGLFEYFIASGALIILFSIVIPFLIPLGVILLLGGLAGLFISHIRPFRVLHPNLEMNLKTGDCSITGINGAQQYSAPVDANFTGFTGLTVNFPAENQTVFLLGFALRSIVF